MLSAFLFLSVEQGAVKTCCAGRASAAEMAL